MCLGYDTNLMSNFYAYPPFRNRFGNEIDADGEKIISAQWQTIISNGTQASLPAIARVHMPLA